MRLACCCLARWFCIWVVCVVGGVNAAQGQPAAVPATPTNDAGSAVATTPTRRPQAATPASQAEPLAAVAEAAGGVVPSADVETPADVEALAAQVRALRVEVAELRAVRRVEARRSRGSGLPARRRPRRASQSGGQPAEPGGSATRFGVALVGGGGLGSRRGGGDNPFGPGLRLSLDREARRGHSVGVEGALYSRSAGFGAGSLLATGGYRLRLGALRLRPHVLLGAISIPAPARDDVDTGAYAGEFGWQLGFGLGLDLDVELAGHWYGVGARLLPVRPGFLALHLGAQFLLD